MSTKHSNSNADEDYNILSRPKRSINYEKFDYDKISPELLKNLDEDSESEDEEFLPDNGCEDDYDDDDETSSSDNDEDADQNSSASQTSQVKHLSTNGNGHSNGHAAKNKKNNSTNSEPKLEKFKKEKIVDSKQTIKAIKKKQIKKSKSDSNSNQDEVSNILNRPRRSINYEKFDYDKMPPELINSPNEDSESEDEDFLCEKESEDGDESTSLSENSDDSEEKSNVSQTNSDVEIIEIKQNGHTNGHSKQVNGEVKSSKTKATKSKPEPKAKKIKKEPNAKIGKTKKANAKNKQQPYQVDEDTQKLINSFRTAKIVNKSLLKNAKANSVLISEASRPTVASNQSVSLISSRDKPDPITDWDSPWICCLCSNPANYRMDMGDLFGPYRVNLDLDEHHSNGESKGKAFKELWLHEGCAVWSPTIYLKDNRLRGIAGALSEANISKCSSCKNFGATLKCSSCIKKYHFPCAINDECTFDEEEYTVLCKNHAS